MKFVQIFRKSTAVILLSVMLGGCVLRDAEPSGMVDVELSAVETLAGAAEAETADVVVEPVTEAVMEGVPEVVPEPAPVPVPDAEPEAVPVPEPETEVVPEPEIVPETPEQVRERRISEELAKMTVREKLGQMFMAAYNDASAAAIADYAFGAYILFAGNFEFETVDTLSAKMADLQSQAER